MSGDEYTAVGARTTADKFRFVGLETIPTRHSQSIYDGVMRTVDSVAEMGDSDIEKNKDTLVSSMVGSVGDQYAANGTFFGGM